MTCKYVVKKSCPDVRDISHMYVFFKNGDFFKIRRKEIMDVKLHLYDNLVLHKREFSPVCESGFIKLRIKNEKSKHESFHLYNPEEFGGDRRLYIENRLLTEGGIDHICMFNENNWHKSFFGDAYAEREDGYLIIKYRHNDLYGPSDGEYHAVRAGDLTKSVIEKIDLDFENCESFEVFGDEIEDISLSFEDELEWNSDGYGRRLQGGFIKLRLNPDITWRRVNLHDDWNAEKRGAINRLVRRLSGRKGQDYVDICHLYVTYDYAGFGMDFEERISVEDIRSSKRPNNDFGVNDYDFDEDYDDEDDDYDFFISGYAEKHKDGTVFIFFGGDPNSETYKKWLS